MPKLEPKKMECVYAVVQSDEDGEAICWYQNPEDGSMIPLIGSGELEQLASLKQIAKSLAVNSRKFTRLIKFTTREEVEEFSPIARIN